MTTALIVVDVQRDFCEGGSLAVVGGAAVARDISDLLAARAFPFVVATRDYHIDPGPHFSNEPDFRRSWPPHCRAGTPGAEFHPYLDTSTVQAIFDKGHHSAAYSGFEGVTDDGVPLATWLRQRDVQSVTLVGIATDHCVRATALDAIAEDFGTRVLLRLTAGVAPETTTAAIAELTAAGVDVVG